MLMPDLMIYNPIAQEPAPHHFPLFFTDSSPHQECHSFTYTIQIPDILSPSSFHLEFPNCTTATHPSPDGSVAFLSLSPNRPIPENSSFTIPSSLSRSNPAFYDYTHSCFRSWDTDSDGVTDFDEFQNSSNPLLLDTDSDHVPDHYEDAGNLTMTSGGDPEIVDKIEAHFTYHWKGITIEKITISVTVHVRDDAGLDYAKAKCEGAGGWKYNSLAETESFTITTLDGKVRTFDNVPVKEAVTVFEGYNADFTGAFLTGYDIEIEVGDVNGYGVKGGAHLDGIVEGWVKAALKWLEAMIKALTELLAGVYNWIWKCYKGMMNCMDSVKKTMENVMKMLENAIHTYFSKNNSDKLKETLQLMFIGCIIVDVIISTISTIARPFVDWVVGLIATIGAFLIPLILVIFSGASEDNKVDFSLFADTVFAPLLNSITCMLLGNRANDQRKIYFNDPIGPEFGIYDPELQGTPLEALRLWLTGLTFVGIAGVVGEILLSIINNAAGGSSSLAGLALSILSLITACISLYITSEAEKSLNEGSVSLPSVLFLDEVLALLSLSLGILSFTCNVMTFISRGGIASFIAIILSGVGVALSGITLIVAYNLFNEAVTDTDHDEMTDWQKQQTWKIHVDKDSNQQYDSSQDNAIIMGGNSETWDSDGDGLSDGFEMAYPHVGSYYSDDERANRIKTVGARYVTDPCDKDTDNDGLNDGGDIIGRKQFEITSNVQTLRNSLNAFENEQIKPIFANNDQDLDDPIILGLIQPVKDKTVSNWKAVGWQVIDEDMRYFIRDDTTKLTVFGFEGSETFEMLVDWNDNDKIDIGELTVGTNPVIPDSDGDGIIDGNEVFYWGNVANDFNGVIGETADINSLHLFSKQSSQWSGIKYYKPFGDAEYIYMVMTKTREDVWKNVLGASYKAVPWYADQDNDRKINMLDDDGDEDELMDGEEAFGYSEGNNRFSYMIGYGGNPDSDDFIDIDVAGHTSDYYDGPSLPGAIEVHRGEGYRRVTYINEFGNRVTDTYEQAGIMSDAGSTNTDSDTVSDMLDIHNEGNLILSVDLMSFMTLRATTDAPVWEGSATTGFNLVYNSDPQFMVTVSNIKGSMDPQSTDTYHPEDKKKVTESPDSHEFNANDNLKTFDISDDILDYNGGSFLRIDISAMDIDDGTDEDYGLYSTIPNALKDYLKGYNGVNPGSGTKVNPVNDPLDLDGRKNDAPVDDDEKTYTLIIDISKRLVPRPTDVENTINIAVDNTQEYHLGDEIEASGAGDWDGQGTAPPDYSFDTKFVFTISIS